jgi:H+/Cl- antiporter ClcA
VTDTKETAGSSEPQAAGVEELPAESEIGVPVGSDIPKIRQIVFIALVSAVFTLLWLSTYYFLNTVIWDSDFILSNRWMVPVGVLFFSFLIGLVGKYMRAPNVIHGGITDQIKDPSFRPDYTLFPGALLSSFFSLLSGASVGPEGPLAYLIIYISAWISEKLKLAKQTSIGFAMAGLASAYDAIVGSPLFSAVFATETETRTGEGDLRSVAWNLLAGVIGFMFFGLIGFKAFAGSIPLTPVNVLTLEYAVYSVVLGVIGAVLAIFIGVSFQSIGKIMDVTFKGRFIARIMAAGAIIAVIVYFIPEVMFSGESQIHTIIANPSMYGAMMLLGFAILKVLLLALSFKSGYLGGPIFPTLFASTMVALAISLVFPSLPVALLITGIEAAAVALVLRAPLAAILLVSVVATSNIIEIAYVTLATATALVVGAGFTRIMAQRAAKKGGDGERNVGGVS